MSYNISNAYSNYQTLDTDEGATAAAVEIVTACSANSNSDGKDILNWAITGDNLKNLRDKIKANASGQ